MDYFEEPDGNEKKPKGPPCSLDWENARLLCKFLRLFYEATLRFSGSLIVTSNSYFHELVGIQNELYKLCNLEGDSLLKSMAEGMKMKYEKYRGNIEKMNLLLFVAVVLDPRYKMKYIVYWFNKWYDKPQW